MRHKKKSESQQVMFVQAMHTLRKIEKLVTILSKMGLIYDFGGGRSLGRIIKPIAGQLWTDCSGCVCYVLTKCGITLKNGAGSTWSLAEEGEEGWSEYLTLCIKNEPADDAHVIVRGRKRPRPWHFGRPRYRYWECGGSDNPSANGGPNWFIPGLKMGLFWKKRVEEFYIQRNFDKQLGLK